MEVISVTEKLPENKQYVLAYAFDRPWSDRSAKKYEHLWVVVKFYRGLSIQDRKILLDENERKLIFRTEDEHDNNEKPYCWNPFGPGVFFGQEISHWCELPDISKIEGLDNGERRFE